MVGVLGLCLAKQELIATFACRPLPQFCFEGMIGIALTFPELSSSMRQPLHIVHNVPLFGHFNHDTAQLIVHNVPLFVPFWITTTRLKMFVLCATFWPFWIMTTVSTSSSQCVTFGQFWITTARSKMFVLWPTFGHFESGEVKKGVPEIHFLAVYYYKLRPCGPGQLVGKDPAVLGNKLYSTPIVRGFKMTKKWHIVHY